MSERKAEAAASTGAGTLFLVALPIGNLGDITYRAVETLRSVALIAAEDTRDFRRIQRAYAIDRPVVSYHDYNERTRATELVARLCAGENIALVSDAGTPLISDPGFRIVAAAIEAGAPVSSLPGPCAAVTALAASGLPVNAFHFLGFPPRAAGPRRSFLAAARNIEATLIIYEAPHRLIATLTDALATFGDRPACLARNLTKPHERYQRGSLASLLEELAAEGEVRGEATLLIGGASPGDVREERCAAAEDEVCAMLAAGEEPRGVIERIVQSHGLKRRDAYQLVLRLREQDA